jgi:hypothetical protein
LLTLEELEQTVVVQTLDEYRAIAGTIEKCLNTYIEAFGLIGKKRASVTNDQERVWSFLTISAFKSLRWAHHVALRGYYGEALLLTRAALESWLVCVDCIEHPETAAAYLDRNKPFPWIQAMAKRLPDELRDEWMGSNSETGLYGFLNWFSHPNPNSRVLNLYGKSGSFDPTPQYLEAYFLTASYGILHALRRMSEFIAILVDKVGGLPDLSLSSILDEIHQRQGEIETKRGG